MTISFRVGLRCWNGPGHLALLAAVALSAAAGPAAAEEVDPDWVANRLIWDCVRDLKADPAGNALAVINRYTTYLITHQGAELADLRARVLARRGEAYAALLDFAAAEADFKAANEEWPGSAREELGRALVEPPAVQPGSEPPEEEEEEEPSEPSEPWEPYYESAEMKLEVELTFRFRYLTDFLVQKAAPSQLSFASRFHAIDDLGFSESAPSGGLTLRLNLGDGVLGVVDADLLYMKARKEVTDTISYKGGVFSAPSTVETTMMLAPMLMGLQVYPEKDKPHFAVDLGMRVLYESTTMEGTTHGAVTNRELHFLPYFGLTVAFDISEGAIHSVLDAKGMYWTYEDSYAANGMTLAFLQAGWEWGFRLAERVALYLGVRFEYDEYRFDRASGRDTRFAMTSLGASLKLELRVF